MKIETNDAPASAATPVTMTMDRDTFFHWLHEVQGRPKNSDYYGPVYEWIEIDNPRSPYSSVSGYEETEEGIVIARFVAGSDDVRVTMRCGKPGDNLMRLMIEDARLRLNGKAA